MSNKSLSSDYVVTSLAFHGRKVYKTVSGKLFHFHLWKGQKRRRYLKQIRCGQCKKQSLVSNNNRPARHFCSKKCQYLARRADGNHNWSGGKKLTSAGHVLVYCPEHPNAKKRFVQEHRLVVEKHIGRVLSENEYVHHINGIKDDNRIENLCVCSQSEHTIAHNSLIPLLKPLLEKGVLVFDKETKTYKLGEI